MSDEFSAVECQRLRRLIEEYGIRELGMQYAQLMDHAYYPRFIDLFAEDAILEFGPYGVWRGRDEIRRNYDKVYQDLGGKPFLSLHATCNHWVVLHNATQASGRRYLLDMQTTRAPEENPLLWLGVYDDDYRKIDGRWTFARISLQFLWPQRHLTEGFPGEFPPRK
jgi:SnoaL-like domain